MERLTYEHALVDLQLPVEAAYPCPCCSHPQPAFCLVATVEADEISHAYVCGTCLEDRARDRLIALPPPVPSWSEDCECANAVRAQRNAIISGLAWAFFPGSPLSDPCKAALGAYIAALNRLSVDFASPDVVAWPTQPAYEYEVAE